MTNKILPFGTVDSANIMTDADYLASSERVNGRGSGIVPRGFYNKTLRNLGNPISGIAQFIADVLGEDVTDADPLSIQDQFQRALMKHAEGRLLAVQRFASNGTYTPTPGMRICIVYGCGAGGGGGGTPGIGASPPAGAVAGGGGSGTYAKHIFSAADIGASKAVVIGLGGAGGGPGAAPGSNGSSGGNTTLGGTLLVLPGGGGGFAPNVTSDDAQITTGGSAGAFASAVGGTNLVPLMSNSGANGILVGISTSLYGGGGKGGAGFLGVEGPGGGSNSNGAAGGGYGAGGGGACSTNGGAGYSGGAGANGILYVEEYS